MVTQKGSRINYLIPFRQKGVRPYPSNSAPGKMIRFFLKSSGVDTVVFLPSPAVLAFLSFKA